MKNITPSIITTLLLFASSSVIAENYGAIAFDRQTNAFGVSWDVPSQSGANFKALTECQKNGHNCEVVTVFADQCGAYAAGPGDIWGSGYGPSRTVAERWAYNYCSEYGQGCQIKVWG